MTSTSVHLMYTKNTDAPGSASVIGTMQRTPIARGAMEKEG